MKDRTARQESSAPTTYVEQERQDIEPGIRSGANKQNMEQPDKHSSGRRCGMVVTAAAKRPRQHSIPTTSSPPQPLPPANANATKNITCTAHAQHTQVVVPVSTRRRGLEIVVVGGAAGARRRLVEAERLQAQHATTRRRHNSGASGGSGRATKRARRRQPAGARRRAKARSANARATDRRHRAVWRVATRTTAASTSTGAQRRRRHGSAAHAHVCEAGAKRRHAGARCGRAAGAHHGRRRAAHGGVPRHRRRLVVVERRRRVAPKVKLAGGRHAVRAAAAHARRGRHAGDGCQRCAAWRPRPCRRPPRARRRQRLVG